MKRSKKQNYKTTLDSIDILNILKIYDPKLWNYTCLWCVQPNLGRRWVLFKLQNYACFACMYQKFIWSNLVNYETTLVFEICCQIIGRDEGYPNYETTPVLHICRYSLYVIPHNWFNTYVYKKVNGTKLQNYTWLAWIYCLF